MTSAAPIVGPVAPPAPQRATLEEWKAKLESLIERRRGSLRERNRQLCVHLASAIGGAHAAIAEACGPARSALVGEAAARIAPYFDHAGDARAAALHFPAVVAFTRELRGDAAGDSLDVLTARAQRTVELLARILDGREIWRYEPGDC